MACKYTYWKSTAVKKTDSSLYRLHLPTFNVVYNCYSNPMYLGSQDNILLLLASNLLSTYHQSSCLIGLFGFLNYSFVVLYAQSWKTTTFTHVFTTQQRVQFEVTCSLQRLYPSDSLSLLQDRELFDTVTKIRRIWQSIWWLKQFSYIGHGLARVDELRRTRPDSRNKDSCELHGRLVISFSIDFVLAESTPTQCRAYLRCERDVGKFPSNIFDESVVTL